MISFTKICLHKTLLLLALSLFGPGINCRAQEQALNTLAKVVERATTRSPGEQIAEVRFLNAYWRYQVFRTQAKPRIDLDGTLPDFFRALDVVTQPTGEDLFVQRAQISSRVGLRLQQVIPFTGGTVFLGTSLQWIDLLGTGSGTSGSSFLTTPINLTLTQPLFQFNPYRWERIIAPLEWESAQKQRVEDHARLAVEATRLFFDLLEAQVNETGARRNIRNTTTLFEIGERRYQSGRIPRAEYLQLRLNKVTAERTLAEYRLYAQTLTEQLREFLNLPSETQFQLRVPEKIPDYRVDPNLALTYAQRYRAQVVEFKLRLEEAHQEVARARGAAGFNADLFASFGLSQTGPNLGDAYSNLVDQELVRVGFTLPLADWGKARAAREVAQTNLELTRRLIDQDSLSFERDILVRIQQLNLIRQQVSTAAEVYDLAQERLTLTQERYTQGKALLTDYNLALQEETNARFGFINSLREFWLAHYEVQGLTLYDFSNGTPLAQTYPND